MLIVRSENLTSPATLAGGTGDLWQSLQFDADDVPCLYHLLQSRCPDLLAHA